MLDEIQKRLLEEVADLHDVPEGAYNIRANGAMAARNTTANIDIISKTDKSGIDIKIKDGTKKQSVHIPVVMSQSGMKEMVYNDFYVGEDADVVIVAVKPHLIEEVLSPVRGQLADKAVVSVAAGWPFERYEALLPGTRHLSTMPNTPVRVCAGVFLLEEKHSLTPEEYVLVQELFGHLGLVQPVESRLLGIAGTLSGCGPAFVSMFIEALGDAGVKRGLPRAMAYRLAGQMVAGTGRMQVETGAHPGAMKDAVCSPGGTTIVGVAELERGGMRAAVINAVDAIQNK